MTKIVKFPKDKIEYSDRFFRKVDPKAVTHCIRMSNPKLSQRDKNIIVDKIKDKMVDTICSRIMDESASDSQLISGVLKKNLGDKINEILANPSNEAKISDTIFQAINSSLRHTVKGPLLLYSILNNKESFNQTKVLITHSKE